MLNSERRGVGIILPVLRTTRCFLRHVAQPEVDEPVVASALAPKPT